MTIPGTVTTIADGAFAGCENLRSIYVFAPEPISLTATEVRNMVTRADGNVPSQFEGVDFNSAEFHFETWHYLFQTVQLFLDLFGTFIINP